MRPCIPDNLNFITREFGNYPLGKGFLTGKMDDDTKLGTDDFRSTLPRLTPEALKANQALVDLREIDDARPRRSMSRVRVIQKNSRR